MTQFSLETYKGPKPMIPADWIWGVNKFLVDEKGGWYIEGYCSTYDLDLVGDIIEPSAAKEAAKQLVGLTLLYNHDPDQPVGTCVAADADEKGIWVKCLVSKTEPEIWEKVKEGVLNKFSVRLLEHDRKRELRDGRYINRIKKMKIVELSLTSLPANMAALAGLAYVGKSMILEVDELEEKPESIRMLQEGIKQLISDFESGALADIVDEELKQYGYGDGAMCPFYKMAKCPMGEEQDPAKQKEIATACPNSTTYTCPYFQADYSAEKYPPPGTKPKETEVKEMALKPKQEEKKEEWMTRCMGDKSMTDGYADEGERTKQCELIFTESQNVYPAPKAKEFEDRLSKLETAIDSVVKITDTIKGLGEAVQKNTEEFGKLTTAMQALTDLSTKVETVSNELKSLKTETAEKIKTLETQTAGKKGLGEGDPPDLNDMKSKSKWTGAFPW